MRLIPPGGIIELMIADIKKRALHRSRILEGQMRGLEKMIESEDYCMDIIAQSRAIQKALASLDKSEHEAAIERLVPTGDESVAAMQATRDAFAALLEKDGVAVGVRDAGHIGLESLIGLLPPKVRIKLELLIHVLVGVFGALMLKSGWLWATMKWNEKKPMLGVPEGIDYVPLVIAGALIVLFSVEHFVAILRGEVVKPAWE